jgi:hypothetical protein
MSIAVSPVAISGRHGEAMEQDRKAGVSLLRSAERMARAASMEGEYMATDRKVAKGERAIKVKGVEAKREHNQPYATEVEDYGSDAVRTPKADPRRKTEHPSTLDDAADRLRPLAASRRGKAH